MRALAALALALAVPSSAQTLGDAASLGQEAREAARRAAESRVFVLKVLSYNIKGTPIAVFQGFGEGRYKRIGRILARRLEDGSAPHVVLIQESFVARTKELREQAGYPHAAKGPGRGRKNYDGGLYVLSRFPIAETANVAFGGGRACAGWDCWANKGALLARVQVPGLPFPVDLYTTHLQSGGDLEKEAARVRQIELLAPFLAPNLAAGRPSIFAGDVNTKPERPSYALLLAKTGLSNSGADCRAATGACVVAPGTDPAHLVETTHDQHLYTPVAAGGVTIRPVRVERNFTPLDELSDHLGYEVDYEIRW